MARVPARGECTSGLRLPWSLHPMLGKHLSDQKSWPSPSVRKVQKGQPSTHLSILKFWGAERGTSEGFEQMRRPAPPGHSFTHPSEQDRPSGPNCFSFTRPLRPVIAMIDEALHNQAPPTRSRPPARDFASGTPHPNQETLLEALHASAQDLRTLLPSLLLYFTTRRLIYIIVPPVPAPLEILEEARSDPQRLNV